MRDLDGTDILSETSIFKGLTREQRAKVRALMKEILVSRGEKIVVEGENSDALFVVVRGEFIAQRARDNEPMTYLGPGKLIGEVGFFGNIPRTATVTATQDSCVMSLSRDSYRTLIREMPDIIHLLRRW